MIKTATIRRMWTLIFCVLVSLAAVSQSTPPGTQILNQAQAQFSVGTTPASALSNTVTVQGQASENLTLTASKTQIVNTGSVVTLAHTLTNTGNAPTDYRITYQNNPSGSSATVALTSLKIYQDLNGNGVVDSTDPEILAGSTVHLNAGASAGLLVVATLPVSAQTGAASAVLLTATSTLQNINASNTDTLTIAGVIATLQKTASATTASPNDTLAFTLTASNSGNATADPIAIIVDGSTKNLVVVRDTIPANTSFNKISNAGAAQALYHLVGEPNLNTYTAQIPADLSAIDAIAFALPNLPASGSATMSFAVSVHPNASGTLTNVAQFTFKDGGTAQQVSSATITVALPASAPTVNFVDSAYNKQLTAGTVGTPVYLRGIATACNLNPLVAEQQVIHITTQLSHDDETFSATETGPNTGIYRVGPIATQNATTNPVVVGDSILQVLQNDRMVATLQCGSKAVAASFYVDPAGIVFDSKTNAPIANASVTLIDVDGSGNGGHAGQPAIVFALDGVTSAPSTVITGVDGRFQFPQVAASTYRLHVTAPNGYKIPSTVAAASLPAGRMIDLSGSYLGNFAVNASTGTVMIDVPADTASLNGLFTEKTASKTVAEIGDFVDYTVTVKNNTGASLAGVIVTDKFPKGFEYIKGTARLNNTSVADPSIVSLTATFPIGALDVNTTSTLTYRLTIGPGSSNGKFANIAQAHSPRADSNQASAVVEVQGGVFDQRGYIVGNVTTSCAGTTGGENFGVSGVKVYMEDGTYALTDAQGRYSFYGVSPATHVLKVDAFTLPRGTQMLATSNRSMSDGGTLFVDLKYGELRRADFQCACNSKIKALVEQKIASKSDELSTSTKATLSPDVKTATPSSSSKSTTASGTLSGGTDGVTRIAATSTKSDVTGYPLYTPEAAKSKSSEESEIRRDIDDSIGFANLKSGDVLPVSMANIIVKGPTGSSFTLIVNGSEVPKSKIGDRTTVGGRIDTWTYVAVDLKPGHNRLEVSTADPFGNLRKSSADVIVNSEITKVVVTAPKGSPQADGSSLVPIKIELFDRDGMAFKSEAQVTLEASAGAWLAKDFDDKTPGVQTFVSGAHADIRLLAPSEAGDVRLRVVANGVATETTITFVPALRPMTAAGVVEYALNFSHASRNSIIPADGSEGFEDSLRLFSTSNSSFSAGARSAMYLKGKVLGSNLLTMSYDSNKVSGGSMFRDIQPDQFYPVYGDSSTRGFDAQSTSKLYLRIDNGKSYLLYGDFLTSDSGGLQRTITGYNRSLTGLKHHYDNGRLSATSFASYDSNQQVVQEFAANGTSGPFTFSYQNGVQNSEKVELLVRDRNHQAVIIAHSTLSRFTEYEFEPFTGRLLLKSPIPTLDEDMNPVYIRVTYEVEKGGARFWAGGMDSQYKLNNRMNLGMVAVVDSNPQKAYQLYGLNYSLQASKTGTVSAELGNTHDQLVGSGIGYKVEYKEERKNLVSDVYLSRTTVNFSNQSGALSGGRGEAGAKLKLKVDSRSSIEGEYLRSEDITTGGTLVGARFGFERKLSKRFKLRIDLRHAAQSTAPSQQNAVSTSSTLISDGSVATPGTSTLSGVGPEVTPNTITTVGGKITVDLPELHKSTISAEFQQDVTDPDKHSFAVGASTAIGSHGKIYARHEFLSSLGNMYTLNGGQSVMATVVGIDTDYLKQAHIFSEFRQHDELTNRDSEAAIGLRNLWQLRKDLGVSAGFESIRTFDGKSNNSIAITGGVEFSAGAHTRGSARAEWRGATANKSFLTTFSLGRKIGNRWTLLTRDVLLHQTASGTASTGSDQFRIQGGAAYRGSAASKWDVLALVEFRNQTASGSPTAPAGRLAVFSTNVNYQPARGFSFSGRYATKFLTDDSNGLSTSSFNQMFSYHVTKDVSRRVDIGLVGNILANQSLSSRQQGIGAEIGFQLKQNLWISSGYNFLGFRENDLPGGSDARQGAFVRLRFKFDENILKGGERRQLQQSEDAQQKDKE